MVDLSIIIVSWNAKRFLLDCLKSIEDQPTGYSRQIIVVDNDSKDGSPEAVESEFPSVQLIRTGANLGFAKGNNIGIAKCEGRYIALINSDVIVLGNCIDALIRYMDANPKVGACTPRILNEDRTLQPNCRHFPNFLRAFSRAFALDSIFPNVPSLAGSFMNYWPHDSLREVEAVSGCFVLARREAVDQIGGLDEGFFMYGEDVDWCKRLHGAGWKLMFNPEVQAIHFGGASSSNAPVRYYVEMHKADLRYWGKHHGLLGRVYYATMLFSLHIVRLVGSLLAFVIRPSRREETGKKIQRSVACLQWLIGF